MTPEELDKATADEAWRLLEEGQDVAVIAARLAREGWTPPKPVDPDAVAFRAWLESDSSTHRPRDAYLAGARMAREQERKRRSGLVATMEALKHSAHRSTRIYADVALKLYNAGRADHDT